ncbi:hypothetical protein [Pseudochrobactrum asaccharolyticum]|uniref:Minor tail protein Z (GPZ) n=1 Tax=Pseudochrobactrum asaccharolyticum TaxID=354351 RepID=A0A366DK96_9HYPH|nr:hypothetical protein [Pseudochrobactrum asaccharolyticum]RBO90502.1 hypothetical protein DFR47_11363 [Pseudochrobactrum asaccharolyticum]
MKLVIGKSNLSALADLEKLAKRLEGPNLHNELHRGVVDAGRKTKTVVQRAVAKQMGLKAGRYQSYVAANTRGIPRKNILAYDIFGVKGGLSVDNYKGTRAASTGNKLNAGRATLERGTVRSSVWNNPRIFKRSFSDEKTGGFFAILPASEGSSSVAPKSLWTWGNKPNQKRGADGKFAKSGKKYGKVRQLFGPSLLKEIPEDQSLATFMTTGPQHLEREVMKRITKLMRF